MIPLIRQIYIQNFKSIEKARVTLEPFTLLVGANGSGKTNFVNALEFVVECVNSSVEDAVGHRGGVYDVFSRSTRIRLPLGFRILVQGLDDFEADYALEVGIGNYGYPEILRERILFRQSGSDRVVRQTNRVGNAYWEDNPNQKIVGLQANQLMLSSASAPPFAKLSQFLRSTRFYSIVPNSMKPWHNRDAGAFLLKDGSNAPAILRRMAESEGLGSPRYEKIVTLLSLISSGTASIEHVSSRSETVSRNEATQESLNFQRDVGEGKRLTFQAYHMSDGTLRALGVLLAAYQVGYNPLVLIEEPEATIHPAAAAILFDALKDASSERQVIVTTHSADILDSKDLTADQIRVVSMEGGRTLIAPVSEAGRGIIRDKLYTPGELLRVNELRSDPELSALATESFDLFGPPFPDATS